MGKNCLEEAKRLIELIDDKRITKEKEYLFVQSIRSRIRLNDFVSEKQIFWLRDIKDRQLTKEYNAENFEEYNDREDHFRD